MKMRNYITISLVLGVTLAVLDCFAEAFVFHGGSLADQFLRPTAVEIWMRSMLIAACLALGTHFQRMAGKRQEFEAALKRSYDELEQRVHERTRELAEANRRLEEEVAERRRAEKELRLRQFAIDHSSNPIYWVKADGGIAYANQAACRSLGYDAEEFLSMSVSDFDPDFPRSTWPEEWEQLKESGTATFEAHHRTKQGRVFPVEITTNYLKHEGQEYIWAYVRDITARQRADEALRRSEERLDLAVRGTSDGLWDADLETGKEYWSPRYKELLGYGEDEIEATYDQFLAFLHPEDKTDLLEAVRLHLEENQPYDREFRMQTKCGEYRWFRSRGEALRDKSGRPYRMAGSVRDVTDRKQAEEALHKAHEELERRVAQRTAELVAANRRLESEIAERKQAEEEVRRSELRLRTLVASTTDVIFIKDREGRYTLINEAGAVLFGCRPEDILGKRDTDLFDAESAREIQLIDRKVIAEQRPHTYERQLSYDGQNRIFHTTKAPYAIGGEVLGVIGIARDITESKHAEQALQASEERFRRAVMDAPLPIMIHAEDGEVLRINTVWTDLTGYHPEEIPTIGDWAERAYGARQEDARERIDILYRIDGRIDEGEVTITTKDGRTMIWNFSSSPLGHMEDGRRLVISMATDVTEQRRAEAQVHKQQEELAHMSRLGTMGEMATGLAHELNQPLTSIVNYTSGCVQRIQAGQPDLQELVTVLDEASSEARRAGEIIKRIRRFVQKREPARTPIDILELIQEVLHLMRYDLRSQGIQTHLEVEERLPTLQGDRIQLQQVLLNLLRNSVQAMNGTAMKHRRLTIGASTDNGDSLTLFVRDAGCGLGHADPDRMFEPFYTTREDGTGMGLAISRTIIEAHGGRLWATDNADGGCTFRFSLPQHSEA